MRISTVQGHTGGELALIIAAAAASTTALVWAGWRIFPISQIRDRCRNGPKDCCATTIENIIDKMRSFVSSSPSILSHQRTAVDSPPSHVAFSMEVLKAEEKLLQWITALLKLELHEGYEPNPSEVEWIKRVWRFYFAYLQYLRCYQLKEQCDTDTTSVFISYSLVRDEYAKPLKEHLERRGVENVFLDETNLPTGAHPSDRILCATLTCKHFWCVITERYIQRCWPMREFFIACCRYMREEEGFSLRLDCLEATHHQGSRHVNGTWMERLRDLKCLQLYDVAGWPNDFPASMHRMLPESYTKRIESLAARKLEGGTTLVFGGKDEEAHYHRLLSSSSSGGFQEIHPCFPSKDFIQQLDRLGEGHTIRLLNTWIPHLEEFLSGLISALERGAKLQVLLLLPTSPFADARNKAIAQKIPNSNSELYFPDFVKPGIHRNIKLIQERLLRKFSCVEVRFYDSLPTFSFFQAECTTFMGLYFHDRLSVLSPHFEFETESFVGKQMVAEFETLWDNYSLQLKRSTASPVHIDTL